MIPSWEALRKHWLWSSWVQHVEASSSNWTYGIGTTSRKWMSTWQVSNSLEQWRKHDKSQKPSGFSTLQRWMQYKQMWIQEESGVGCRCTGCKNQEHQHDAVVVESDPILKEVLLKVKQNMTVSIRTLTHINNKCSDNGTGKLQLTIMLSSEDCDDW